MRSFNLAESANLKHDHAEVVRLLAPVAERKPTESSPKPATNRSASGSPARQLLPAVLYRLGRTYVELKDWASAATTLDRLITEFPDNPYQREARYLRAESNLRAGDAVAAESAIAALLNEPAAKTDLNGFTQSLRLKRIECWVALKRWKDVLAGVGSLKTTLAAGDPTIADLDFARGQALFGLGRLDKARAAFQAVIDARNGDDPAAQAQLLRGETYFHQDLFREALREFLKVDILYKTPHWRAAALLEAGKVYERLDQWTDAAESYRRLCTEFATDPSAAEARTRREAGEKRAGRTDGSNPKS